MSGFARSGHEKNYENDAIGHFLTNALHNKIEEGWPDGSLGASLIGQPR
jgi:hypothetical protein